MQGRIEHLDILKALAIVFVVMGHVLSWCYQDFVSHLNDFSYNQIVLWKFIYSFHMPLFMFVSGVVVFNPEKSYSLGAVGKRILTYLIPFFVIDCLLTIYRGGYKGLLEMFMRMWYFRTLTLFVLMIFIPMYIVQFFPKINRFWSTIIVSTVYWGVACYVLPFIGRRIPIVYDVLDLEISHYALYPFFLAGWIYRRFDFIRTIVENKFMYVLTLGVLFFSLIHPFYINGYFSPCYNYVAFVAIAFFLNLSIQLTSFTKAKYLLNPVGKQTMEIYIIHGFMATCIPMIGQLFIEVAEFGLRASMSIQLFVSLPATILIIYLCLLIAKLIRNNDLLSLLAFGDLRILKLK